MKRKKNYILIVLMSVVLLAGSYAVGFISGRESSTNNPYGDGNQTVDVLIHENSGWVRCYYGKMSGVIIYDDGSMAIEMKDAWLVGEDKED